MTNPSIELAIPSIAYPFPGRSVSLRGMRTTILIPLVALAVHLHGQAGLLDNSFSGDGKTTFNTGGDTKATAVLVQPDGKILVAGSGNGIPGNGRDFVVARYMPDGTLDAAFGVGGIATKGLTGNDEATCIALQSDGKIVLAGFYTLVTSQYMAVARLNPDGSADTGFGLGGQDFIYFEEEAPYHSAGAGVAIQTDGRIVVCGSSGTTGSAVNSVLARFDPDGSIDTSFGTDGKIVLNVGTVEDRSTAVAIQSDGRIVISGYSGSSSYVARFLTSGAPDPSFQGGLFSFDFLGGPTDRPNTLLLQEDGRILLAGTSEEEFAVVRLEYDGYWDNTFGDEGRIRLDFPENGGDCYAIRLQADHKILLGGTYLSGTSPSDMALARLNGDGSVDTSFGVDGWLHYDINGQIDHGAGMALQADGKVILVGDMATLPTDGTVIRVLNDVGIGIPEADAPVHAMSLYPNPAADQVQFNYALNTPANITLRILENSGRVVRTPLSRTARSAGTHSMTLDLEGLPAGAYLVELRTEQGIDHLPLIRR